MPRPDGKPGLSSYPIRISVGIRAKLDFDFSCGRGHSFGEYHVHGIVNEILCSNIDSRQHRVWSGFAHPNLRSQTAKGRRREVDFGITALGNLFSEFYAEVKWAGSPHCSQKTVLRDLCRLQIIKNDEPAAECVFILAGYMSDINRLFSKGILLRGTRGLLQHATSSAGLSKRGSTRRTKNFSLTNNVDHRQKLQTLCNILKDDLPSIPRSIRTILTHSEQSAPKGAWFQALVWSVELC